jgi:hypothetical protein
MVICRANGDRHGAMLHKFSPQMPPEAKFYRSFNHFRQRTGRAHNGDMCLRLPPPCGKDRRVRRTSIAVDSRDLTVSLL